MGVSPFLVLQFVLLFIIGIAGFQRLARELQLGPIASTAFIAILLLNGNLVGHLGAGHFQWAGYFVIPWVFLFLHRASAGDTSSRTQAGLALALGLMVAVGGWHVFVWCVIFVGVFLLCNRARWWLGAGAAALAAGLIAYRVFPAIMVFGAHDAEFLHGYEQITVLLGCARRIPSRHAVLSLLVRVRRVCRLGRHGARLRGVHGALEPRVARAGRRAVGAQCRDAGPEPLQHLQVDAIQAAGIRIGASGVAAAGRRPAGLRAARLRAVEPVADPAADRCLPGGRRSPLRVC